MSTDCSKIYNLSAWTHSESVQFSVFSCLQDSQPENFVLEFNRIKKCMKINPENDILWWGWRERWKNDVFSIVGSVNELVLLATFHFISQNRKCVRSNKSFHLSLNQKLTSWQVTDHETSSGVLVFVTFSSVSSFHYSDTRLCLKKCTVVYERKEWKPFNWKSNDWNWWRIKNDREKEKEG